jgi:hypothetical protein
MHISGGRPPYTPTRAECKRPARRRRSARGPARAPNATARPARPAMCCRMIVGANGGHHSHRGPVEALALCEMRLFSGGKPPIHNTRPVKPIFLSGLERPVHERCGFPSPEQQRFSTPSPQAAKDARLPARPRQHPRDCRENHAEERRNVLFEAEAAEPDKQLPDGVLSGAFRRQEKPRHLPIIAQFRPERFPERLEVTLHHRAVPGRAEANGGDVLISLLDNAVERARGVEFVHFAPVRRKRKVPAMSADELVPPIAHHRISQVRASPHSFVVQHFQHGRFPSADFRRQNTRRTLSSRKHAFA